MASAGEANRHPMSAEVALRVGLAAGKMFVVTATRRHLVVIGKDTRLSGYMLEAGSGGGLHLRGYGRASVRSPADPGGGDDDAACAPTLG